MSKESQLQSRQQLLKLKKKQLALLKHQEEYQKNLPHLYMPMYAWQRKIVDSTNRVNLITASNQSGKSTALIRRAITIATDPKKWKQLWGLEGGKVPRQLWYFYPDGQTIEREITTKWIPEWLPRGPMEIDPVYGWKLSRTSQIPNSIKFNSGVSIFFQMYTKKVANVQAGTVYEVLADEEVPMPFYDELMFRLTATNGIFTTGFTPTLNQFFWKQAMETNEVLPSAFKMTISMYDCLKFDNGAPSTLMTIEKIRQAEERCQSEVEKQRRIFGKFVTEAGRSYYAFEYDKHVVKKFDVSGWPIYAGVDYGSGHDHEANTPGGKKNHPASILFLAVSPDFKKSAVIRSWRGDGVKTTAGDVFQKYQELVTKFNFKVTQACYDASAKDFGTIAQRNGVSFQIADKSRDSGQDLVNTLFRHGMLVIFDDDSDDNGNLKLASELMSIMVTAQKSPVKTGDDLADALRYDVMQVPWDLSILQEALPKAEKEAPPRPMTEKEFEELQIRLRRGENVRGIAKEESNWDELEDEFSYWNDQFG